MKPEDEGREAQGEALRQYQFDLLQKTEEISGPVERSGR